MVLFMVRVSQRSYFWGLYNQRWRTRHEPVAIAYMADAPLKHHVSTWLLGQSSLKISSKVSGLPASSEAKSLSLNRVSNCPRSSCPFLADDKVLLSNPVISLAF
ncbi:hypothetical protein [Nostoc sp. C117]|uniref:hypothetical protein n=1 Tax=Nostoc sp. C117 TaxID=3349875 RepID=UPI00370D17BB